MTRNIPNSITCCNLISGCIAIAFAYEGKQEWALAFIIIGAVFDFFDGMVARLLHVSSPIGKELDSLADDITFGAAPAMMVFTFLHQLPYPDWLDGAREYLPYVAFLIAAFSALRLAKFNLDERQATSFIGLPTPANALFWGSLIVGGGTRLIHIPYALPVVLVLIVLSCWMLVAEIPLFALKFKQWGWKGNETKYIFLITCIPLIVWLGMSSLAVIITWYVILSIYDNARRR
ncbi:MAG: CDP-diacylglycerol--serine O-phosphatidyltransferase [Prevotella sp.]|nr:CDP-diacylglycerol--serine O-phosphatidyltransferase [Prevotella sp.]